MLVLLVFLVASFVSPPATVSAFAADQIPSESPSPNPSLSPSIDPSPTPDQSPSPEPSPTPSQSPPPGPDVNNVDTSSLIVKTVAGLSPEEQLAVIVRNGGVETSSIPALRLHVVAVPVGDLDQALQNYGSDAQVESVDRDRTRDAEGVPSDPSYPDQWALPKIAWDQAYGSIAPSGAATIAVLDTGVDNSVTDLSGRLAPGHSAFPGSDPGVDPNGHGTWLASIAAAATDNAQGIAGVSYADARIMPVQVLDAGGMGQDSDIIGGVVWAADHGADVILMGFSNPGFSNALQDAVEYAWSKGVVLVAATGNDGSSAPTYPAGDAKVVGVSATDSSDVLWTGSNYGADTFLAAPGVGITADVPGTGTTSVTGTSASAAIIAGAAALLKANDSSASPGVIVGRLARNADPAGSADQTGNGRVNLARSLGDTATDPVVPVGAPGGGPLVGPYVIGAPAVNLDQWANGQFGCEPSCSTGWQNGNLNSNSAHYHEGDSVPFRVVLSNLTAGPHTLDIDFPNTTNDGHHAYDYLTSFDRTAAATPCTGIPTCTPGTSGSIPSESYLGLHSPAVPQVSGSVAIWNGDISGVTYLAQPGTAEGSNLMTTARFSFTVTSAQLAAGSTVIAWGGHTSSELEWGPNRTIGTVSGSSYHMELDALDGKGIGGQDRAAQIGAILQIPTKSSQVSSSTISTTDSVTDSATFGIPQGSGLPTPQGTATFFICGPTQTAPDCSFNGTQVGGTKTLNSSGTATSDPFTANQAGVYCFRAQYTPAANSPYSSAVHTNITTECFTAQAPSLSITKTADAGSVDGGQPIGFTVTVTNSNATGTGVAKNVTLTDTLPTGPGIAWSIASQSPPNSCSITGGVNLSCSFGNLAKGASASVHVTSPTTTSSCGTYNNTATAQATNNTPVNAQASVIVVCPSLTVTKVADAASVDAGDQIGFVITVKNTGNSNASNVTLTDSLPTNSGLNWSIDSGGSDSGCSINAGTLTCNFGTLAPNASKHVHITSPTTSATCGTVSNTAWAGSAQGSATVTVKCPVILVTKSPDAASVDGGDQIGFLITVSNSGQGTAKNVSVSDPLPSNAGLNWSIDAGGSDAGCSIASGSLTCGFGNLASGSSKHVHITSPTTRATCGTVSNTATASASNDGSAQSSASVIVNCPAINVTKSVDKPVINAGDTVTYTYTVTNAGDTPLSAISVSDDKCSPVAFIGGDTNSNGKLDVGETWTYTCSTSLNADTTNTATASATSSHGHPVSDTDTAFVDVRPSISVTKTASPTSLPEPGGPVQFTVKVKNNSIEAVTLNSLTDDVYGDLDKDSLPANHTWTSGDCDTGGSIAAGATYECHFIGPVTGEPGNYTDTATAMATDDDGSSDTRSGSATVTVTDVTPTISVTKSAIPSSLPEPGGAVQFTVKVKNTSFEAVTLNSLTDDVYGDLDKDSLPANHTWTSSDCDTGGSIAAGATYECHFTAQLTGQPSQHTDTATAKATDNDGSSDTESGSATVEITNATPSITVTKTASPVSVSEPGGSVTFTVKVTNTSVSTDPVTLTSLTDDVYGDLNGQGTCATGVVINSGDTYSCSFVRFVGGNAGASHTDTVTGTGRDDENTLTSDDGSATVTVTNVAPSITVTKTASPTSVNEPGGSVTFTVQVKNTSVSTDPVTLTSLSDDKHGNLNGQGNCAIGGTITSGDTYSCSFTASVSGNAGDSETDVATANVTDDENTAASDHDDAKVTVANAAPSIIVTKSALPTSVDEPGGSVTFTVNVTNTSVSSDPVTLDSLTDDVYGDLNGQGTCATGGTIVPGDTYSCHFTVQVTGNANSSFTDKVTANVTDDENTPASDTGQATVTINNVAPSITVTKSATPDTLDEPGGTVTFTVKVTNTSVSTDKVTLDSLVDDVYGDLNGQGTCATGGTINPGDTYSCHFDRLVGGNAGFSQTDKATANVTDDENTPASDTGQATVTLRDVAPAVKVTKSASPTSLSEPGGSVTFTVKVTNASVASTDALTLSSLVDDIYGDLNGQGTCATPQTIFYGASYSCSFTKTVSGNAGFSQTDKVTGTAQDDEFNQVSDTGQATVTLTNSTPTIQVTKSASPATVDEPGGTVSFSVTVKNTSVSSDAVTLDSLTDDVYGDLNGQGTCSTSGTIAPGDTYTCSFTGAVSGNAGSSHTDKVTAKVHDDENTPASDTAQATVNVRDVAPAVQVTKSASPSSLSEPGGAVTFTVKVTNASLASTDPLTLTSLVDDVYGNLNGQGSCATPQTIPYGGSYTCSFTKTVTGNAGFSQTDKATGTAHDDENNQVSDTGSATVTLTNATPTITVTKTASPTSVSEPGGAVSFTVTVKNTSESSDPVTLDSLTDDVYGDLNGKGNCATGGTINPGATYSCSFTESVSGNAGGSQTDKVTAKVHDDETTTTSDTGQATVTVTNSTPTIQVTKSASPSTSPEPVGNVTFTLTVKNTSVSSDPVTLDSLIDNVYGDLNGKGSCATGGVINPGATYSCSFTVDFTGNQAGSYKDIVTAKVHDDENTLAQGSADATVTVTRPRMSISKTVDKPIATIGEELAYTISYTNSGDATAYNAVIVDSLPSQVTYKGGSATGPAGTTIEYSPNGSSWYSTEAGAGGAAAVRYIRWTIPTVATGSGGSVGFKATVNYPTGAGTAITNSATLTSYCSRAANLERCYQEGNTAKATTTVVALQVGSTSTMTNSAFQLVDDLGPWTINDFEILMNPKYTIIATNPGQFYYHQRGTVPAEVTGNTSWEFKLSWPAEFVPQTEGGQPIHAYIQYANDAPNTWRDWTPQSTSICWNSTQNMCSGFDGTITVNNVPPGAKVWVTVHLDYALKGQTKDASFLKTPKLYTPFQSDVAIKDQSSGVVVGASSSSTSLLGRGKKVTTVYGTMRDPAGNPMAGVWVQISQNGKTALAQTGSDGFYLFYDGQNCVNGDGLAGGCSSGSTWAFANGTANATLTIYGKGPQCDDPTCPPASPSSAYPSGYTKATITSGQINYGTLNAPVGYTLSVANGTAYNRDWKFTP